MKRIVGTIILLFVLSGAVQVFGQTPPSPVSRGVKVSAQIGVFYLSISGITSTGATVSLIAGDVYYKGEVADQAGKFKIPATLINKELSNFCLNVTDAKRMGAATACYDLPSITQNVDMTDVLLPPTISLKEDTIPEGRDAEIQGYTIPGASIVVHLQNDQIFTTAADQNGYYDYKIKGIKMGTYQLFVSAAYNDLQSKVSSNRVILKVIKFSQYLSVQINKIWKVMLTYWYVPLILLLIAHCILMKWPELLPQVTENKYFAVLLFHKRRLDHWWFVGY